MSDSTTSLRRTTLAVIGVGLLLGGGYGLGSGVAGLGDCGSTELVAEETTDTSRQYTNFTDLSTSQQELARKAIRGERPVVTGSDEWPWFESALRLHYQGEYYELYTVTQPCAIPPGVFVILGAVGFAAGLGVLATLGRQMRSHGNDAGRLR